MFGLQYIKFDSMHYVMHYINGRIQHEGRGLSFFYFAPNSSIVAVPLTSNDLPFMFSEATADYQAITLQGQITFRIKNPKQIAEVLDLTVNDDKTYITEDYEKLENRLINEAKATITGFLQTISLKEALKRGKEIEQRVLDGLQDAPSVNLLGIEILSVNIMAIKATPEMSKALEAATREALQQEADKAIYDRRNFAVEQERMIKESELNTEIAVEEKHKQISEKKMETELLQAESDRKLRKMKLETDTEVEEQRSELTRMKVENQKLEADAEGYRVQRIIEPYKELDWKTLMALNNEFDAKNHMAFAFRELAENANKIGTLNITPDLLETLIKK